MAELDDEITRLIRGGEYKMKASSEADPYAEMETTYKERRREPPTIAVGGKEVKLETPPEPVVSPFDVARGRRDVAMKAADAVTEKARLEAGVDASAAERMKNIAGQARQLEEPPRFTPTPEDKATMVGMFGLLGAMAAFVGGGKQYGNALSAMNAMGGMLAGYNQGRKDLFEKDKQIYDKKVAENKAHNDHIKQLINTAMEEAKYDYTKAKANLKLKLAEIDAPVIKAQVDQKTLEELRTDVEKADLAYTNNLKAQSEVIQKMKGGLENQKRTFVNVDGEQKYLTDNEIVQAQNEGRKVSAVSRTAAGAPGGAIQFRYNQAVANASYQAAIEVQNYASLPLKSAPPEANAVLTDPAKGVTDATIKYFAQNSTSAENRAVQQATAGLNRAIATIAASGRPGGVTEAAIKEFSKMAPTAGDKKINTFLYLAMMRQEFDVAYKDLVAAGADPKQIALAEEAKNMAYEAIPFTVQDVTRILRSGGPSLVNEKTKQLLTTSDRLKGFETSINKVIKSGGGEVVPAPAAATTTPVQESENKRAARAAISAGAPREAVIKRLQEAGEDTSGL